MNLQQIKDKNCPICGSRTVAETKDRKHTNGYWNESRSFGCGAVIKFSPNFMRTEMCEYHQCPYKPEVLEKTEKRKKATEKLINYIYKTLKVDENFKDALVVEVKRITDFRIP